MKKLSVILPSYRPNAHILRQTVQCLEAQSLSTNEWELLMVASGTPAAEIKAIDGISWRPEVRFIHVSEPGLTRARVAGINEAAGEIIVFVDDDNFLENTYLSKAVEYFESYPHIVAAGGKCIPEFEGTPSYTDDDIFRLLALRDLGDRILISDFKKQVDAYPDFSPIGAGMIIRRESALRYAQYASQALDIPDRTAGSLTSGGDNDIILYCLKNEGEVAYFPDLVLRHFITEHRLTLEYLAQMNFESSRSWVKVLKKHGLCVWSRLSPAQACLRRIVAYFKTGAWCGGKKYIIWRGICGHYRGRQEI